MGKEVLNQVLLDPIEVNAFGLCHSTYVVVGSKRVGKGQLLELDVGAENLSHFPHVNLQPHLL